MVSVWVTPRVNLRLDKVLYRSAVNRPCAMVRFLWLFAGSKCDDFVARSLVVPRQQVHPIQVREPWL